jgi:hypothetical protein
MMVHLANCAMLEAQGKVKFKPKPYHRAYPQGTPGRETDW